MKIKKEYKLRKVAGETIIVNQGNSTADMTRIISLNSSAELLYKQLEDKEFSLEDAAKVLVNTYHIGSLKATEDAKEWVKALKGCEVITD